MTELEAPRTAEPETEAQHWAWIGGASDGLGYAFAEACAQRGHSLLLLGRWLPRRLAIGIMSRATANLATVQPSERPG